jgi:ATP-binding cassette subfamily F protein 3
MTSRPSKCGEKVKVFLAGLLLDDPTILLLDEPTNNLDDDGVEWLIKFIKNFNGSAIIVSHDRYLINQTVDKIWEMDSDTKEINVFSGNYDNFMTEKKRLFDKKMQEYNHEAKEIEGLEQWLRAHEMHPKYRFSSIVASKKARLAKLRAAQKDKPATDPEIKINNLDSSERGRILKVKVVSKKYNQNIVFENVCFDIHKNEKILIKGKNGSGKTTLLNIITGVDTRFEGEIILGESAKIGYLKQFSDLNKEKSIIQEFEAKTGIIEPQSRKILARFLFGVDQVMSSVGSLSFGQLKRLDLAILLTKQPNILVLDEPTNHLDIYTREELESFIIGARMAMIVVSHDRYFIEKIGFSEIITIAK